MTNKEIFLAATAIVACTPTEFWKAQRASGLSPEAYLEKVKAAKAPRREKAPEKPKRYLAAVAEELLEQFEGLIDEIVALFEDRLGWDDSEPATGLFVPAYLSSKWEAFLEESGCDWCWGDVAAYGDAEERGFALIFLRTGDNNHPVVDYFYRAEEFYSVFSYSHAVRYGQGGKSQDEIFGELLADCGSVCPVCNGSLHEDADGTHLCKRCGYLFLRESDTWFVEGPEDWEELTEGVLVQIRKLYEDQLPLPF